jgi:hypothetical protein
MKKLCLPIVFMILCKAAIVCAQSDSDTDPDRWEKVKSWQGTFTFTAKDEITRPEATATIKSNIDASVEGDFTLDKEVTPLPVSYGWEGEGKYSGSIFYELETIEKDPPSICTNISNSKNDPLAPLVGTPGFLFEIYTHEKLKGKYTFKTGEITIPITRTVACDGTAFPPVDEDWEFNGPSTVGYRTLPQSGYHIIGDVEMERFNGFNSGWFHWDLQPKEFKSATSVCAFEAALHDTVKLNILRGVRDYIANSRIGVELIYRYYAHVPEITKIIMTDAALRNTFRGLIINNIHHAQELIAGGETRIPCDIMQEVISFLTALKAAGSQKLQKDIAWVLAGIEDTSFLDFLGIIVEE